MAGRVTAMDVKMLVATLPADANVSEWCRRLGISRQTFYKWRGRFRPEDPSSLENRSRAANEPHGRTPCDVEDLVVGIRKELAQTGLDHGPASVRDRLMAVHGIVLADATVWRILSRRGQITPHPNKRPRSSWRRFSRDRPNECWQGDDTHYFMASGQEVRIINIVDDHSRLNVDSLAVAQCRSALIWESFCRGASRHGVPAEFLNDNGRAWISDEVVAPVIFQQHLGRLGVHQIHSSPYHPQTCGKVERFHQTQRRYLDAHPTAATIAELQELLDSFRGLYNEQRPHRAIGRRTPASVWAAKPPATPARRFGVEPPTIAACRVSADGRITPGNRLRISLGAEWAATAVTVLRWSEHAVVIATQTGEVIRELTLEPGRADYPTGEQPGGPKKPRRNPGQV